ncbi:MAG: hypothetical protein DHS20C18_17530 [Saprospiraceae bacterium]|nr:MAG: hypothetical protein DHS20C18_17530 [Saprospiraceae bacterium]
MEADAVVEIAVETPEIAVETLVADAEEEIKEGVRINKKNAVPLPSFLKSCWFERLFAKLLVKNY